MPTSKYWKIHLSNLKPKQAKMIAKDLDKDKPSLFGKKYPYKVRYKAIGGTVYYKTIKQ